MWRKPNESQPSSPASDSSSPSKTQTATPVPEPAVLSPVVPEPMPPVAPSQPGPSFSASVAAPVVAPVSAPAVRGTSKVASGLKVHGEVSGNCDLYVDGEVQGMIRLPEARVTVGPTGRVQADIEASEIFIEGTVQGNLKASERTHLGSTSRVTGSILTPRIGIDDGASLRGKVEMVRAAGARQSFATGAPKDVVGVSSEAAGVKAK